MIYFCVFLLIIWTIFVMFCLFNGKNIEVALENSRVVYWEISAISFAIAIYLLNEKNYFTYILMFIVFLVTIIYSIIPSGYNKLGIYVRGFLFRYKTIESVYIESFKDKYRLNFKYRGRIVYVDSKDIKLLKECEILYKKENYQS